MPSSKTTNADLLAALQEQSNTVNEKLDLLTTLVEGLAARRTGGRQPDTRKYRYVLEPNVKRGIDRELYEAFRDETFTRVQMVERLPALREAGKIVSKRGDREIVGAHIPWCVREGCLAVAAEGEEKKTKTDGDPNSPTNDSTGGTEDTDG